MSTKDLRGVAGGGGPTGGQPSRSTIWGRERSLQDLVAQGPARRADLEGLAEGTGRQIERGGGEQHRAECLPCPQLGERVVGGGAQHGEYRLVLAAEGIRAEVTLGEASGGGDAGSSRVQQVRGGDAVVAGPAAGPRRQLRPVARNVLLLGLCLADRLQQRGPRPPGADHPQDRTLRDGGTLQLALRVLGDLPVAEGAPVGPPTGDGGRELEVRASCSCPVPARGWPAGPVRRGSGCGGRPHGRPPRRGRRGGGGAPHHSSRSGPCRRRRWRAASASDRR